MKFVKYFVIALYADYFLKVMKNYSCIKVKPFPMLPPSIWAPEGVR